MISLGSREDVVFIDQVNLRDLGLISPPSLTTLLRVDFPAGVYCGTVPSIVLMVGFPTGVEGGIVPSIALFENFDDSFEKKEFLAAALRADVSCDDRGTP